jgi:glucose-6-phosphate 1-dehydrogenase
MIGDRRMFAREDSIEETWRIVAPLLEQPGDVHSYESGSWGPEAAHELVRGHRSWQDPWLPEGGPAQ